MSAIQSQLKQAIQDVSTKSSEVSAGNFSSDLAAQAASAAQSVISVKEGAVNAREKDLDTVLQKLAPPPTKDISEGGKSGGTKTVVDQEEVKKLETQKASIQSQLEQAKSEVADARQDAEVASTKALTEAGISQEKQSEMQSLTDRISAMQDSLSEGKQVDEKDVAKLITDFHAISDDLTKDQNKSGLISKAFYDPVKDGLENISKLMEKNASADSSTATGTNENSAAAAASANGNASGTSSTESNSGSTSSETSAVNPTSGGAA